MNIEHHLIFAIASAIFGVLLYNLTFKNRKNPSICKTCNTEADLFDYSCKNPDCKAPLLRQATLFILSFVLIGAFFFLISIKGIPQQVVSWNEWPKLPNEPINNYLLYILLIVSNLLVLSFINDKNFWVVFYIVNVILIFCLLSKNFDYLIIIFSIIWIWSFYELLNKFRINAKIKTKRDEIVKTIFRFFDILIIFAMYALLIVGISEVLVQTFEIDIEQFSQIFGFITQYSELFKLRRIIMAVALLLFFKDVLRVVYFDKEALKNVIIKSNSIYPLKIAQVSFVFLKNFLIKALNSINKYGVVNLI